MSRANELIWSNAISGRCEYLDKEGYDIQQAQFKGTWAKWRVIDDLIAYAPPQADMFRFKTRGIEYRYQRDGDKWSLVYQDGV